MAKVAFERSSLLYLPIHFLLMGLLIFAVFLYFPRISIKGDPSSLSDELVWAFRVDFLIFCCCAAIRLLLEISSTLFRLFRRIF